MTQSTSPVLWASGEVFHCVDHKLVPFEQGRRVAAGIPGARFVALDSANHALLSREPAWEKFAHEMEEFLADGSAILTG